MKMKKIVSAFAALAMAASSFAAFTISASAEVTYDKYGIGEVVFGTNNNDGTVSDETFDDYDTPNADSDGWSGTFTNVEVVTGQAKTLTGYLNGDNSQSTTINTIEGNALRFGKAGTPVKSFSEPVTNGIVKFSASYFQGTHAKAIELRDSENNSIISVRFTADAGGATQVYAASIGDAGNVGSGYVNTPRTQSIRIENVSLDLDKGTISYDLSSPDRYNVGGGLGNQNVVNVITNQSTTFSNTDISGIAFSSASSNYADALADNISLYATMPTTRHAITFNVKDDRSNPIAGATVAIDGYRSVVTDESGVATVYVDESTSAYTYSVTTEDAGLSYEQLTEQSLSVTASSNNVYNITLNSSGVRAASFTINRVDASNTSKILDTITIDDAGVGLEYDVTSYTENWEYTDDNGIVYIASYAGSATTFTPENVSGDTCTLQFNLTEKTYPLTVKTAPYAQVSISGQSTSGSQISEIVNSNASGEAAVNIPVGTAYTATIQKGGYTEATSDTFEVTKDGATVQVNATLTDANELYHEDFETAVDDRWGLDGAPTINITGSKRLEVIHPAGAGGQRNARKEFAPAITTQDNLVVSFDLSRSTASDRSVLVSLVDDAGQRLLSVGSLKDDTSKIYALNAAAAVPSGNDEDSPALPEEGICDFSNNTVYNITADINFDRKTITVTVKQGGEVKGTQTIDLLTTSRTIKYINFNPGRAQITMTFDNFIVSEYKSVDLTNVQAEYKKIDDTTAQMRFLAMPEYDGALDITSYGFWFVDLSADIPNVSSSENYASNSGTIASGETFHYTTDELSAADGQTITTVAFYAIPWVQVGSSTIKGTVFTYDGDISALSNGDVDKDSTKLYE